MTTNSERKAMGKKQWTHRNRRWAWWLTHSSYSVLVFSGRPIRAYEALCENEGEGDFVGLGRRVRLSALQKRVTPFRWKSPSSLPVWARMIGAHP